MSNAVIEAQIRAFDQFSREMQRYRQELERIRRQQDDTRGDTDRMNRSFSGFLQTIGNLGALYAFQRGLREVMGTGREFELTIKQAQAVVGDFSSTLRDLAMVSSGNKMDVFNPTQLAQAYRELGAAGADINSIIAATPDILEFGTAAMLDMDRASASVLSTAKSFNIELSDSKQIVDAYTEAMNLGALAGEDFQWIMGSVGAVAKMAGQDFREILSVGSAMRDSGIQAQDAGTSIKAALLQLINPTKEAQDVMEDLGINIYDASGKMKQWSKITAEFEKALAPFNQQSRNLVLTTVLGADGIRAMATSINKGSGYLREFTDGLKNSEGATHKMASAMADTFDGAIRRTNASLERSKVLLFEDFEQGAVGFLDAINTMLIGFNNLDETSRKLIVTLVGGAGLVVAISTVISTMRMLGITMATVTAFFSGPIGWVTALAAALVGLSGAVLAYKGHQEQVNQEIRDSVKENFNQAKSIETLLAKYEKLSSKTNLTESEQDQLKKTVKALTDAVPSAITGFDAMGEAITNVGTASQKAREEMERLREEATRNAEISANIARAQIPELERKKVEAQKQRDLLQSYMSHGNYEGALLDQRVGGSWVGVRQLSSLWKDEKEIAFEVGQLAAKARDDFDAANKELTAAQAAIKLAEDLKAGRPPDGSDSSTSSGGGGGGISYDPSGTGKGSKKPAAEAAKKYIEAITDALYPYQAATEAAANAVGILGAKEQYLSQVMESGQGTAQQAIELNKTRAAQLQQLSAQQDALHKQADAERLALAALQERYQKATDPDTARELRDEIDNLTGSVAQLGQQWWQAEQQKLDLTLKLKQEEKKRYDDAYQQAMDLMRHQVNMARMSTEQQIEYLIKLRNAYQWSQSQMDSIDEDLYRLRKKQLQAYLDSLEDEYQEKLDAIDARVEKTTKAIQDQIDALEREGKGSEREEALRKHNEKLKQLEEQRRYHELRTGVEHQKAIQDIDRQIAEENIEFQRQQEEWSREDKKDALQEQLDDARKAGDEERKRLEQHYRKVIDIANKGALDTLAALAATDPKWLETGKNWIKNLIDGIELMEPEFQQKINEATKAMDRYESKLPSPKTTPDVVNDSKSGSSGGSESSSKDTSNMTWQELLAYYGTRTSQAIAAAEAEITRAGQVYTQKWNAGDKAGAAAAHKWADQIRKAIGRSMIWDQNTEPDPAVHNSYAKGGPILYDQIAQLHAGEYVIPANLVDAIRRGTTPPAQASGGGGITVVLNGPLLAPEKLYLSDDMDIKQVGMGLRKEILALATSRGW